MTAMVKQINGPVTHAKVEQLARDHAENASSVLEIVHPEFNADERSGGYAYVYDRTLLIYAFDGSNQWSIDPGDPAGRLDKIEQYWRKNQHQHRQLTLNDVSESHRAAIAAIADGLGSVGELPAAARPGVTDFAVADHLLVWLRRYAREPTAAAALRVLAANDWLLEVDHTRRAHPCPVCGLPAIGRPWIDIVSACDSCCRKAECGHGRRVDGYNADPMGGFEAVHLDDRSVCEQVTRDGSVWVDRHPCRMGEAKFGGVYVGVAVPRGESPS
jgi:hypothetical protein